MTDFVNTANRYGRVAILLHWAMAALLVGLILLGLYMVALPETGYDMKKISLILLHKELGILAWLLALVRVAWRSVNPLPALEPGIPFWQRCTARFVHLLLYALMFCLPLSGWLMSSTAGIPVSFFVLVTLPDYLPRDERWFHALVSVHGLLADALMLLLALHAGAALAHHFLFRDATLMRMLPGRNGLHGYGGREGP
ncbi:cytochrome b [Noviherbaspirillum pedocola]|uniref:Cytochrome b n=1 Tax=Noviherbaspirillum pedocola TaxID=2801341 RepID=A0A934T006_9BURK|nr:cytochrome b [Noviherbaspirillum pedocola]MBK4738948.1 cytochrome b [Noviherbaspirillum pedocola]